MRYDSIFHFTARIRPGSAAICTFESALWLWNHLRRSFPQALGAVLMPNHFHLLSQVRNVAAACRSLRVTLGHFTRLFQGSTKGWMRLDAPTPVLNTQKLLRTLRYIALNPCRAKHATDPLCWFWSTHRDVMGAVADPWISADRLASVLKQRKNGFQQWYHAYVSSDPSVNVDGTPAPDMTLDTHALRLNVTDLVHAASRATRMNSTAVTRPGMTRTLFIHQALFLEWTGRKHLTKVINASTATLNRVLARPPRKEELHAGLLCLADPRLQ